MNTSSALSAIGHAKRLLDSVCLNLELVVFPLLLIVVIIA